ncbi:5007_t:CDS:2 [Diversispora eburnea]|uniref:5007_t:CDS:1 n=1 Tax=Diversispora eburnea TaxID=1213867 RepID=A0A9N9FI65_9GLOM|nr:5007_t:CDS:2 [Diversispora eburnea]
MSERKSTTAIKGQATKVEKDSQWKKLRAMTSEKTEKESKLIIEKGKHSSTTEVISNISPWEENIFITTDAEGNFESFTKIMGCGIIVKKIDDMTTWNFNAKSEGPPSSNRTELGAIIIALKIMPTEGKATIYSDSLAMISAIKIVEGLIKKKKTRLHKVTAHAGDKYNELADEQAKKGAKEGGKITTNMAIINRMVNVK